VKLVWVRSSSSILAGVLANGVLPAADARAEPGRVGTSSDAQPGIFRVPVAESTEPAVAVSAGYGYTEKLAGAEGASHRVGGRLAGAIGVLPWLNVGGVVDARHDRHSDDSGTLVDGGLALRGFGRFGSLRLGAEVEAWVPGSEAASTTFRATSLDARALFGAELGSAELAVSAGYRLDRSAEAGERAPRLSFGDRAALGLSDFDAILAGIGLVVPVGSIEVLAEVSGNVLIGKGAPPVTESPLHATAGGRLHLSERLSLELLADASLGKRPAVGPAEPLVPIDPRVSGLFGLRYRFVERKAPAPAASPAPATAPKPVLPVAPVDAPFEVALTDEDGAPVRGAEVTLKIGERSESLAGDDAGIYRHDRVPRGPAKLVIRAPGYEPFERDVVVEPGKKVSHPTKLKSLPPPSQVRGVVRSFGGQALVAKVRVDPLGVETTTDETGSFQVDVAPGSYEVTIEAEGYESQRRQVRVDAQGVVILNADLVRKK
jgi:hypothetical protein